MSLYRIKSEIQWCQITWVVQKRYLGFFWMEVFNHPSRAECKEVIDRLLRNEDEAETYSRSKH